MSWTHPICEACWSERNPNREPVTVNNGNIETCCYCGEHTKSGIYIREDPVNVKFSAAEN